MLMLGGNARAFWHVPPLLWFIINTEYTKQSLFLLSTHVLISVTTLSHPVLGLENGAHQTAPSRSIHPKPLQQEKTDADTQMCTV